MARERAKPIRRSSPLRFLPRMSNFLRDQIISKGLLGLGAWTFMATLSGPDFLFFFFFCLASAPSGFDVFAMVSYPLPQAVRQDGDGDRGVTGFKRSETKAELGFCWGSSLLWVLL